MQGVSKTDFENYVKANDAVLRNMQNQGQGLQNQMTNLTEMLSKFINSNTASSLSSELDRTNALADSGASINLLPHSIYKQLGLGALKPTRMTLELANRSVTHPMGIAEMFCNDDSVLKKDVHKENFQVYSNSLFEFDDHFTSSNVNPLFNEMVEDVENENSNVSNSNEPVLLNTHLFDKVGCSNPEVDIDEINAFLAMKVSPNFEEGYYDSEGDVIFLESLFSDDTTHNISLEVIFDHEPKQNESFHNTSITFSPRSDPLHHEFAGEIITLPSRIATEHEEYLSLMTLLCEISTSQSPESFHANPSSIITSPIPVQEEIDIFPGDLIPPGVEE
ncbi:reverse transcriptase domain-containing protein [Tanacetum coccineum]|uniref:Reverse transcriptase domain-containing protein n=1 Tax=Tanacetum coccineum TaxID=301880 RepID=A0ABQ4WJ64_9ASTR